MHILPIRYTAQATVLTIQHADMCIVCTINSTNSMHSRNRI